MQIIGYDLYSEGIRVYKSEKNELAYTLYKDLVKIQDVLKQNDLDFTIESNSGEKSTLSTNDIMNNLSIFAMNLGKKDEAKSIFESEVKRNPTALGYTKLIQICNQTGDLESARKYTLEGVDLFPNDENLLVVSINMNLNESNIDNITSFSDFQPLVYLSVFRRMNTDKEIQFWYSFPMINSYQRIVGEELEDEVVKVHYIPQSFIDYFSKVEFFQALYISSFFF